MLLAGVVGVAAVVAFFAVELRRAHPLFDVRVLARARVAAGSLAIFNCYVATLGMLFLLPQRVQYVEDGSALASGAVIAPFGLVLGVTAALSGRLVTRHGPRVVLLTGLLTAACGFVPLLLLSGDSSAALVLVGTAIVGGGIGLVGPSATTVVMNDLGLEKAGDGAAVNQLARQVGGALGVAIVGSVFAAVYAAQITQGPGVPAAKESIEEATRIADRLPGAARVDLLDDALASFDVAARWGLGGFPMAALLLLRVGVATGCQARPGVRRRPLVRGRPTTGSRHACKGSCPPTCESSTRRCLLDLVDDGVVGTDPDFRITQWNLGAQRLYGYAAEAGPRAARRRGRDVHRRRPAPAARARALRVRPVAPRADGRATRRHAGRGRDRRLGPARRGGHPSRLPRDPSRRDRAPPASPPPRAASAVIANSRDFIGFADLDGRVVFVKQAGLRLLGLPTARMTRDVTSSTSSPSTIARACATTSCRRHARRPSDGAARPARLRGRSAGARLVPCLPRRRPAERPSDGIATISRDRRRSLRQEAPLRESERRAAAVLESVTDPLLGLDGDLRLTFLNEAAVRLAARLRGERPRRESLMGAPALTVLPAVLGAPLERAVATAQAERRPVDGGRHCDEVGGWWQVHVYPADGGVSVLLRDVSDERAAEHASARRSEQQALVALLGARSARADDLRPFLEDAVRGIGRAVGATVDS